VGFNDRVEAARGLNGDRLAQQAAQAAAIEAQCAHARREAERLLGEVVEAGVEVHRLPPWPRPGPLDPDSKAQLLRAGGKGNANGPFHLWAGIPGTQTGGRPNLTVEAGYSFVRQGHLKPKWHDEFVGWRFQLERQHTATVDYRTGLVTFNIHAPIGGPTGGGSFEPAALAGQGLVIAEATSGPEWSTPGSRTEAATVFRQFLSAAATFCAGRP